MLRPCSFMHLGQECNGWFHQFVTEDNVTYAIVEFDDGSVIKTRCETVVFTDR